MSKLCKKFNYHYQICLCGEITPCFILIFINEGKLEDRATIFHYEKPLSKF